MSSQTDDMGLDALRYIDPIMIANYIRTEHPQTIALIISYLTDIDQAATVLRSLPENLQADVVYRIASLDSIPPGVVNELNEVLTDEMKQAGSMVTKVGGVAPVAEIQMRLIKLRKQEFSRRLKSRTQIWQNRFEN